jgi:iron complex outermembrane receptor protein
MKRCPTGRLSALSLALTLSLGTPAARAAPVEFHIPAQSLERALRAFAEQSNAELLYAPDLVRSRDAAAVDGSLEPEAALQQLLAGSGLVFERSATGAFLLSAAGARNDLTLGTLVTTATRTEQRITDVPAAVSVVTRDQIERQHPIQTSDLLRNVEGIDVNHTASLGGSETMNIRGVGGSFAGSTSPVLLDGMPLESPIAGIHVGMKVLALEDMEQIEVVRGPSSALYGPSAVGGVINMISRRWEGEPEAEVRVGAGSHNSRSIAAATRLSNELMELRVSGGEFRTDGFEAQAEPDPWGGRDLEGRDGYEKKYAVNGGLRTAPGQELTFAARSAEIKSAWLGGHPNYRLDNDVGIYDLGYRRDIGSRASIKASYRHLRQQARATFDQDYYMGDGNLGLAESVKQTDETDQLDLQGDIRLRSKDLLTVGVSHAQGTYTMDDDMPIFAATDIRESKSRLYGIFVQEEIHVGERFTLFAGLRRDDYEFFGDSVNGVATDKDSTDSVVSPRLSALWQVTPATGLYAAAGTAYVPAINSLKFRDGVRWRDNPDLDPERAASWELGVHHSAGGWLSRAGYFHVDYNDKISAIVVNQATGQMQFQNLGKATVDGVELSTRADLAGGWQPYLNYAYTESIIRDNPSNPDVEGNRLQYVSPNKFNLGLAYAPTNDLFVSLQGRYVDAVYTDDGNSDSLFFPRLPPYFVADFNFGMKVKKNLSMNVAINNFLDRRYRETRFEEADGSNVWFGLNGTF